MGLSALALSYLTHTWASSLTQCNTTLPQLNHNKPAQLAMVVLLQELLPGLQHPPQLFDPAFSPLDTQLLQQLGMAVIGRNEEGRRSIGGQRTLFFLPHCEVHGSGLLLVFWWWW